MVSKIIATGSCVPDICLTNNALAGWMETSDEWIQSRTGIAARRLAAMPARDQEGRVRTQYGANPLFELTRTAAERALKAAEEKGLSREEIGLILVATSSPDELFPALACRLQSALQLPNAAGYDLVLACTGFLAALQAADGYIRAGLYRNVLVIGGEVLSRFLNWEDRDTAILFGDGAGAVVVSGDPRFNPEGKSGMLCSVLHADGSGGDALTGRAMYWNERTPAALEMDGRAVFSFAVRRVPEVIREVLYREAEKRSAAERSSAERASTEAASAEDAALPVLEPDCYVLHQANYRIIESIARKLKKPLSMFPHNLEHYGNTSAGSIPILLDELNREGKLQEGELLCLAGFGAGLSYGAALLRW